MATVDKTNNNKVNIPQNAYYKSDDVHKKLSSSSDKIIKKTPLTGAKIVADKLTKDIFTYAPKGMMGSRNSNFYEFLSLGLIPNIVGSAMLIALFNAANKSYKMPDSYFASIGGKKMGFGVAFYAVGKWLGNKMIDKGVNALTGVDLEMPYRKVVTELPEYPGDKDLTAIETHKVFESADFPRWDLLNKMGEEQGDRYVWYDKIAKRMGFKEKLNSPDQIVQPRVRSMIVKARAAKAISAPLWAAFGVALASQEPFGRKLLAKGGMGVNIKKTLKNTVAGAKEVFVENLGNKKDIKKTISNIFSASKYKELAGKKDLVVRDTGKIKLLGTGKNLLLATKDSFVQLFKNDAKDVTRTSKYVGRGLFALAALSTVFGILNTTRGFKEGKHLPDTQIDTKKEYEVM